ncbi:MAG: hypothetical protein ABEJ98_01440 [Candidatus Nanohaloarchaea archaeon]
MDRDELRDKAIEETREELGGDVDRVKMASKAVKILDRYETSFREQMEDFRDWYSLHFPELVEEISDDEHLVKILDRGLERSELDAFESMADDSTGSELREKDLEMLEEVFEDLKQSREITGRLEKYIREVVEDEMPNLGTLLGPLLAARLVSLAGGLEDLAKKPSSTIQVLGAEKALFRYLHGEGTPPKHGILFKHSFVNTLPEDRRGKMARFIANKAAMAARLDFYGDKQRGDELRAECQEKFQELKEG